REPRRVQLAAWQRALLVSRPAQGEHVWGYPRRIKRNGAKRVAEDLAEHRQDPGLAQAGHVSLAGRGSCPGPRTGRGASGGGPGGMFRAKVIDGFEGLVAHRIQMAGRGTPISNQLGELDGAADGFLVESAPQPSPNGAGEQSQFAGADLSAQEVQQLV